MRIIKFRGKVKYNGQHFFSGEWVEGYYAYKELDDKHLILVERAETQRYASYFVEVEVVEETVGQFIGLTDKNGIEIYENDIMGIDGSSNTITIKYNASSQLINGGHCCNYNRISIGFFINEYYGTLKSMIILGNIHEESQ